jgi:hypothetical protein
MGSAGSTRIEVTIAGLVSAAGVLHVGLPNRVSPIVVSISK